MAPSKQKTVPKVELKANEETGEMEKFYDLHSVPDRFKANGLEVVSMHLIGNADELHGISTTQASFHPRFVYQFFHEPHDKKELEIKHAAQEDVRMKEDEDDEAEEESADEEENGGLSSPAEDDTEGLIIGYENLKIDIYFSPNSLKPFLRAKFEETLPVDVRSVPDFTEAIEQYLKRKISTTEDGFLREVAEDARFTPFGDKIGAWSLSLKENTSKSFELFEVGRNSLEFGYPPSFSDYLANIQPFLAWFIYASSVINTDDANWLHYFLYEKTDETGYRLAGYCSVYRYFVMISKKNGGAGEAKQRCRIAQFLVLPPYQKQGLGARMLHDIVVHLQNDPKVHEISVEDPEPSFKRLYQTVTSKLLKEFLNHQKDSYDVRSWVAHTPSQHLKTFQQRLKLPKNDLIFAMDVIGAEVARAEGPEAIKELRKHLAARIKHLTDNQLRSLQRTMKRVKANFYTFSEDMGGEPNAVVEDQAYKLLIAVWQTNLEKRIEKHKKTWTPTVLNTKVNELEETIREIGRRMDRLHF